MASSTKSKTDIHSDDALLNHLADMQEKLNEVMSIVLNHADELKSQRSIMDKIRERMGI